MDLGGERHFWFKGDMPETERGPARILESNIRALSSFAAAFDAAVLLFDHAGYLEQEAEKRRPALLRFEDLNETRDAYIEAMKKHREKIRLTGQWQFISARDGAITLYHFSVTLRTIRASVGSCKSILSLIDIEIIKNARKLFESYFPHAESIRHSVAHGGDMAASEKEVLRNAFSGNHKDAFIEIREGASVTVQSNLMGRQFITGHLGKIMQYKISSEFAEKLRRIHDMIFESFSKVDGAAEMLSKVSVSNY